MTDLDKEINRLSNLKQNKNKDRSWIEKQAQIVLWKKQIDLESRFEVNEDRELANKFFENYIINYEISSFNDCQNLSDLVYEEVMFQKVQKDINKILSDENSKFIPDKQITSLHAIQDRIWQLKEKIGITKKDNKDDLTALQELEHKLDIYISFHRNEFTIWVPFKCKSCGKEDVESHVVRRRVKNFDILKHPAFCGRFLYNTAILDDVKKGLITKEQAAKYQKTSPSMIEWQLKNEHKIIKIDGINKDELDEFINNNPYLRDAEQYNEDLKEQIQ